VLQQRAQQRGGVRILLPGDQQLDWTPLVPLHTALSAECAASAVRAANLATAIPASAHATSTLTPALAVAATTLAAPALALAAATLAATSVFATRPTATEYTTYRASALPAATHSAAANVATALVAALGATAVASATHSSGTGRDQVVLHHSAVWRSPGHWPIGVPRGHEHSLAARL